MYQTKYASDNELLDRLLKTNPMISIDNIEKYEALNDIELLIFFKDGKKIIYDTLYNTNRPMRVVNKKDPLELKKVFSYTLNKMLNIRCITQEELANKLKINQSTISRYIHGKSLPDYLTLIKIADTLKMPVENFFRDYF